MWLIVSKTDTLRPQTSSGTTSSAAMSSVSVQQGTLNAMKLSYCAVRHCIPAPVARRSSNAACSDAVIPASPPKSPSPQELTVASSWSAANALLFATSCRTFDAVQPSVTLAPQLITPPPAVTAAKESRVARTPRTRLLESSGSTVDGDGEPP